MTDHLVKLDLDDGRFFTARLICNAAEDEMCRARWDCTCEQWSKQGTNSDGLPYHVAFERYDENTDTYLEETHIGQFDPNYCVMVEWTENSDEWLYGSVVLPVTPQWEGDFYSFKIGV